MFVSLQQVLGPERLSRRRYRVSAILPRSTSRLAAMLAAPECLRLNTPSNQFPDPLEDVPGGCGGLVVSNRCPEGGFPREFDRFRWSNITGTSFHPLNDGDTACTRGPSGFSQCPQTSPESLLSIVTARPGARAGGPREFTASCTLPRDSWL